MTPRADIITEVANIEFGVWCETCLLPSSVTFDVVWLREDGVHTMCSKLMCEGCGRHLILRPGGRL